MTYRIGSLCSGYEGLGMAVKAVLGGELAWVADNDPGAAAILAYRFPGVPNYGDITKADWSAVEPVDILTAGFPCQPVSAAGRRKGVSDERWLFDDITEAIGRMVTRPRLLVLENVAGLLSANGGHAMERVLQGLASLGYVGRYRVLRASAVGAPHRRERWFCVAWPAADSPGRELQRRGVTGVLGGAQAGEPGQGDQRERAGNTALRGGETAADATGVRLPLRRGEHFGGSGGAAVAPDRRDPAKHHGLADERPSAPADADGAASREWRQSAPGQAEGGRPRADAGGRGGAPAANSERDRWPGGHPSAPGEAHERWQGSRATAAGRGASAPADTDGTPGRRDGQGSGPGTVQGAAVPQWPTQQPGRCDSRGEDQCSVAWGDFEPAIRRWESVLGRPAPRPVEPGRTADRLSPAFAEWMMGLPAGWVTGVPGLSRNQQLHALGNGVVPAQAAMALRLLLGADLAEAAA